MRTVVLYIVTLQCSFNSCVIKINTWLNNHFIFQLCQRKRTNIWILIVYVNVNDSLIHLFVLSFISETQLWERKWRGGHAPYWDLDIEGKKAIPTSLWLRLRGHTPFTKLRHRSHSSLTGTETHRPRPSSLVDGLRVLSTHQFEK